MQTIGRAFNEVSVEGDVHRENGGGKHGSPLCGHGKSLSRLAATHHR